MMRNLIFAAIGVAGVALAAGAPGWALIFFLPVVVVVMAGMFGFAEVLRFVAAVLLGIADGWTYARLRRDEWRGSISKVAATDEQTMV